MPRGRPKKPDEADPPEVSYETIREFYRKRAADDSYVTVLRYTEGGTLEYCCQGSPSAVDEGFIQERYGGGKFCFRLKTPDGDYLAQSTVAIAAPPMPPELAAAAVNGADPMRGQFDLMRDQLARQQEMVIHLIDKQSAPAPGNDLGEVIKAVAALRTLANPGNQVRDVVTALTEGMRLGMKSNSGGGPAGGTEDKVNGVLRVVEKVSEMFPRLFGPRGEAGPAPDGSAAGAAVMGGGAPPPADPAAVLRGTINYLKTKITKDPALWAEMILDNVEESHWMFIAQLINKPYDEIAETIGDPDLKREPFKSWFEKLWSELKIAYQSNLDSGGAARDGGGSSGDE